ncbi:hypothetical protein Lal_00030327 [Lupinus albus]|nr:hypothetical protein Lal_00030327 [Lupinus albus]
MDELVSLRGYITTRMDAFDTQSQQIHYELHRLSSRLSNIDVDEDSSEPELLAFLLFDEVKKWRKVGSTAHKSKRKGKHTCIHIGGAYSRQIKISSRGDCEEDLAPDLDTVLMKTPISQKEERKKTDKDYQR